MNRATTFLALSLPWMVAGQIMAQTSAGLISQHEARQVGLQRMWFTQVEVDAGRGRVTHLSQHVSATQSVTIYQVTYDGGRFVVSARDVDRFGAILGPEKAQKTAQIKFDDLKNLNKNPKLETITVPQITLYAVTDSGVVQAIDSETGRSLWKTAIGNSYNPTEAAGASDEYVGVVNGSDLYLLKASNGEYIWKRRVAGAPGAGPAISPIAAFVPMVNGAMEVYPLDNIKMPAVVYRSQGRALFQPTFTGSSVAWPTDRGHLYVMGAVQNKISFRLEANDAIAAPATFMLPDKLLVTSVDGFVYCVQEISGVVMWRFSSGEPILESPVAYGNTVYAVTVDGSLFAIDAEYGQERWSVPKMSKVIGASKERLYCLSDTKRLIVLNQQNGARLGTLSTELLDLPYMNRETDRIVIATGRGLIQCMREIQQENPLIHSGLSKPEDTSVKAPKKSSKSTEEKPMGTADPFGAPAAAPEPAKPEPAPAGDKKTDDPFGE